MVLDMDLNLKEIIWGKRSHKGGGSPNPTWLVPKKRDRHQRHSQRDTEGRWPSARHGKRPQEKPSFWYLDLGVIFQHSDSFRNRPTPTMTVHLLMEAIKGKGTLRFITGIVLERKCLYHASGRRWLILCSCHLSPKPMPHSSIWSPFKWWGWDLSHQT